MIFCPYTAMHCLGCQHGRGTINANVGNGAYKKHYNSAFCIAHFCDCPHVSVNSKWAYSGYSL